MGRRKRVATVIKEFGITRPVNVKVTAPSNGSWAVYWGVDKGEHSIEIHPLAPATAIWHELMHALQCERDADGDTVAFFKMYAKQATATYRKAGLWTKRRQMKTWELTNIIDQESAVLAKRRKVRRVNRDETRAYHVYCTIPYEAEAIGAERDIPLKY